ncbi:hypothetical protein OE766_14500 [Pararhizobium sp. YC-54]|uniref:hypothetical protein n=1 Tax=Pararhizobium sp. YC-54 TaxID=2986920 RepID=UPI0021F7A96A|nr:hypothetical protein [Pararhizobium sp. YC-54]MCV9999453.1 hypothetical protein [Pararhizobium sp. YC-54]
MDFHSTYFFDVQAGGFQRERYRDVLEKSAQSLALRHNVSISCLHPFGFELIEGLDLKDRNLKRFYVYLYTETPVQPNAVEEEFLDIVLSFFAEHDPKFQESFAVAAARSGLHRKLIATRKTWEPNDRLLVAEIRQTSQRPLQDYADYLIACLWAFSEGTIPEIERFSLRSMARTRVFQIFFIVYQTLFRLGFRLPALAPEQRRLLAAHRSYPHFYYDEGFKDPPSADEEALFEYILGAISDIRSELTSGGSVLTRSVKAFHGAATLAFDISEPHHRAISAAIAHSYNTFWRAP